jgi:hypothetical protein
MFFGFTTLRYEEAVPETREALAQTRIGQTSSGR